MSNFDLKKYLVENKLTAGSRLNEEEGTDILSFLKSNKQELLSKLTEKFGWDNFNLAWPKQFRIFSYKQKLVILWI
jgi:hypothetical protein